ncbi:MULTISPECIES: GyrI-like domain-containing protein [Cytobacillus]|uniref:GyrI-like domain-containing protein n=1 Tax=Cytobacillus TaxID=2675230 RepID=UPI002041B079|nr:GyrI-like domain-containing protein [Cytobacillus firmus]MCM3707264.1 GyrI-like domain-containing protein [Cytobacillus firmus]
MCIVVSKGFKAVVIRNSGLFEEYAHLVPEAAQSFLRQGHLVQNSSSLEVAFYEPKRGEDHLEGTFFTGNLVYEKAQTLPNGMEYIEAEHTYASIRGKTAEVGDLHKRLNSWLSENDRQQSIDDYIIEVYYPGENKEEEAEVFIPIKD